MQAAAYLASMANAVALHSRGSKQPTHLDDDVFHAHAMLQFSNHGEHSTLCLRYTPRSMYMCVYVYICACQFYHPARVPTVSAEPPKPRAFSGGATRGAIGRWRAIWRPGHRQAAVFSKQ